ncbi:hypothetical protein CR205_01645 [Alteribacter lacisalsi]|uniref:Fimbrial assembly protein n=1 Tax=Alteribacter lacisalsi TaxID=2045244 RepID=A0A2W0H639_9BACI|nr:hypothetical protein [Alteribacter lacisalsi]PYZ97333.1 hypothetical protein CR205_01645 [Alteribacter lacisalsi]
MPVEINLLSKREKKDKRVMYVLGGFAALCAAALIGAGLWGAALDRETAALEEERMDRQIEAAEIRGDINELSDEDQMKLAEMITEMNQKVMPGSAVLHEMVRLMPPEGYFVEYEYNFPFDVYIEVAFYEMPDVAYYHRALEDSGMVSQVTLHEVTGEDMIPEEDEQEETEQGFGFQSQPAMSDTAYLPHYVAAMTVTLDPLGVKAFQEELEEEGIEGTEPAPPAEDEENGIEEDDADIDVDIDLDLDLDIDTDGEGDFQFDEEENTDMPDGEDESETDLDIDADIDEDIDEEMNNEQNGGDE